MENNNHKKITQGQKIIPFLWFDGNAEEAMNFYTSVFKNSKIINVRHYREQAPAGVTGKVMMAHSKLKDRHFTY